jgi:SNF2 family DNA or RNA helicase
MTKEAHIPRKILETHLIVETKGGLRIKNPATLIVSPTEIEFAKSPFHLKNEIKALQGAKWLGFKRENPRKVWVADNCERNWFQLKYLMGQNPYEWFDREIIEHEYRKFDGVVDRNTGEPADLMRHQRLMADVGLTYHYQIWAAEMGTGKTLSAQCVMEMSGVDSWLWVGPLKSLENIEREWEKWGLPLAWTKPKNGTDLVDAVRAGQHNIYLTTYERLVKYMETRGHTDPMPGGVIFDESSRLKSPTAQRSKAAQALADGIRHSYGNDGFVILMSGTPSPKSPLDWWKQCEIAWPGFLKEGSKDQLEKRLAFMVTQELPDNIVNIRVGWKDDEDKCEKCAKTRQDGDHDWDIENPAKSLHAFEKSKNEVAYMYKRLEGLATVIHQKDVLDLPDKVYEVDICKPSPSTIRVAKTIAKSAPNVMTGITWLRELSDGFMYKDIPDGIKACPTCAGSPEPGKVKVWIDPQQPNDPIRAINLLEAEYVASLTEQYDECPRCHGSQQVNKMKRIAREVPCPKEAKLKARLAQCEETGRIVIFAGFQGSIDRIRGICQKAGWDVVQCDGRGWQVTDKTKKIIKTNKPLNYWSDMEHHPQVAFVAHPASGGLSLNLTESRMSVFWSNDFNPESRVQAEARIHRKGMDENRGCKIVDLYHLPSDEKVRTVLKANRKLELLTMGEIMDMGDTLDTGEQLP